MENGETFVIELYPEYAPETCANFINLVNEKFYDGLTFHRVVDGFMAQGGEGKGAVKTIKGEFAVNGVNNKISHKRGVISMARSQSFNSASSQFFICHADATFLDRQYAAFGEVVEGIETVDKIAAVPTNYNDKPLEPQIMKAVYFVKKD
ncbi:MAG: peptidylprolyl isomerase [Clostridia bacterium]|nr:peptidylprolyl isomerase [Clostridia bacterium]